MDFYGIENTNGAFAIREYVNYNHCEVMSLYSSVGWTAYTDQPERLKKGFANSLLTLSAYDGEKLLGLIRTVGDGETIVFIQDLLVFPQYQRQGVGARLICAVLERFAHVRQIELATDNTEQTIAFYRSLGFRELSELGCCGFMRT